MPRSPEPARRSILDAALVLFATNGISGTSLREIRLAARQGNAAALQYHFQDKEGLLRALLERELPLLVDRRRALLDAASATAEGASTTGPGVGDAGSATDAGDLWSIAAVFVLPFAEMATGTEHEQHVVQFLSQLHDDVSYSLDDITELIGDTGTRQASVLLRARITNIDEDVLNERVRVGLNSYLHAAAIWARGQRRAHLVGDEVFRKNLVDMFLGALVASY